MCVLWNIGIGSVGFVGCDNLCECVGCVYVECECILCCEVGDGGEFIGECNLVDDFEGIFVIGGELVFGYGDMGLIRGLVRFGGENYGVVDVCGGDGEIDREFEKFEYVFKLKWFGGFFWCRV